jgi:hypothetical protein
MTLTGNLQDHLSYWKEMADWEKEQRKAGLSETTGYLLAQCKGPLTPDAEAPGHVLHPLTLGVQSLCEADNRHPFASLQHLGVSLESWCFSPFPLPGCHDNINMTHQHKAELHIPIVAGSPCNELWSSRCQAPIANLFREELIGLDALIMNRCFPALSFRPRVAGDRCHFITWLSVASSILIL